jgi:hypothetical protein
MSTRLDIPSDVLAGLVARHPFYEIARMYDCDPRSVSALANLYGLTSAFGTKRATEEELARIRALVAEGWNLSRIAEDLGRSFDFVFRHVRRMERTDIAPACDGGCGDETEPYVRPSRISWPKPTTSHEEALAGRLYEDMSEQVLCREWPPRRFPVNGAALASAAQVASRSASRSCADLCAELAGN